MKRTSENQRYDALGPIRIMAEAEGYMMVRRPGRAPFVLEKRDWNSLSKEPNPTIQSEIDRIEVMR